MIGLISSPCLHHVFYVLIRVHSTLIFSSLNKDWALYIYKKWLSEGKQIKSNASGCEVISMEWVQYLWTAAISSFSRLDWVSMRASFSCSSARFSSRVFSSWATVSSNACFFPCTSCNWDATIRTEMSNTTTLHELFTRLQTPLCNVYSNVPFYFALDQNSSN